MKKFCIIFPRDLKIFQMNSLNVMIEKTENGAVLPKKMSLFAAGYDLSLPKDTTFMGYALTTVSLGFKVC